MYLVFVLFAPPVLYASDKLRHVDGERVSTNPCIMMYCYHTKAMSFIGGAEGSGKVISPCCTQ